MSLIQWLAALLQAWEGMKLKSWSRDWLAQLFFMVSISPFIQATSLNHKRQLCSKSFRVCYLLIILSYDAVQS